MKPILFFDIESTGVDVSKDRIVTLHALCEINGVQVWEKGWKVNPGIPIPKEATEVHGITDDDVRALSPFKLVAREILELFHGKDLAGFNIANFDVPMLWEEFYRAGLIWNLTGVKIVDACSIYRKMEPRSLSKAAEYYLKTPHADAHDAAADVRITASVLHAQRSLYKELSGLGTPELAAFCETDRNVDVAGKIVYNEDGVECYGFGKDEGKPVLSNRGYAEWMLRSDFPTHTKMVLRKILEMPA